MGVDFPMPVMLKINLPNVKPDSGTPQFFLPKIENKVEDELKEEPSLKVSKFDININSNL